MSDHGYEVLDDPYCFGGTLVLKAVTFEKQRISG
jgi:hypothetical protein